MRTTIILPVSRAEHLDAIFARLEMLKCDRTKTNLLVIVDGDVNLFVKARNYVEMSKFHERLCIQFKSKHAFRHFDYMARRLRISDIHNELKQYIKDCDYVFGLEDDTIIPLDALERLKKIYSVFPYAGFVQGVQLGRWGIPHIGAWKVDDIYNPTKVSSMIPKKPSIHDKNIVQEIDAGGFYCFLTKRDNYVKHDFKPFDGNGLGPDVDFGIELRRGGALNYIDWGLTTVHKTKTEDLSLLTTEPRIVTFMKKENRWRQTAI